MKDREGQVDHHPELDPELDDDDKTRIIDIFFEEVVPKLRKLDARLGNVNCDFAGEQYRDWTILFRSIGSDFEIVDFEYDEDGEGMDLDL